MNIRYWAKVGFTLDVLRVWPRICVTYYFIGGWFILRWYLEQPATAWDKSAFAAVYASLGLPLLKWYMENGVEWKSLLPTLWPDMRYDADNPNDQGQDGGRVGDQLAGSLPTEGAPPVKPPIADRLARADLEAPVEIEK